MASYGTIYEFRFDDINGDDVDIFIAKKNYTGSVTRRALGRTPILKRERSGNILGTSLEIYAECRVDGEFAQLYTSSADEFRVEVYKRQNLLWTGFVSPELYSEPDIAPPYDVQIIATDGLGELKDALFSQDLLSLHNHLDNILEHTGLVLPIGIVSSLSWDDHQVNHSPYTLLTDLGVDLSNRIDDSCYDVLQDILRSLNACITQQDGGWLVIRESDLYDNVENLSPVSFGSVNNAEWWPIGNLSSEIIPAKKRLTLVQENKYRENLLTPIYTGVAGGWDLTSGVFYDDIEKGYIIPSSSDSISYAIDFRSYPLQTQLRLTLRARSISRDGIREEASKMSLTIMMAGSVNGTSGVYHLTPDFLSDNDRTQMKWFGGDKLGFIRSWGAPRASECEPAIQDIVVIIPLYNNGVNKYAEADQLTIEISNAPNSPYRLCIYDAILEADQQYPGVKVVADIANDAREEDSEINVAMATSPDPMLEATMYGQLRGDGGIIGFYTPASSASDLLSFLVRDYAMQVALPRMRYRGKLNVPSLAYPRIPMLFERDNTYYFLNTYSYDLLNSELEVELISIPNAQVQIESETVTELPSSGSGSASSSGGSTEGGGTSGGGGSDIVVDSAMSASSENPVQNKVVKKYVDDKHNELAFLKDMFYWADEAHTVIGTKYPFFSESTLTAGGRKTEEDSEVSGITITDVADYLEQQGYATEQWVINKDYATNSALKSLSDKVDSIENNGVDLTGYATKQWVKDQKYATEEALKDLSDKVDGLPDTDIDLTGYATEQWVKAQGYVTSTSLEPTFSGIDTRLKALEKLLDLFEFDEAAQMIKAKFGIYSVGAITAAKKKEEE